MYIVSMHTYICMFEIWLKCYVRSLPCFDPSSDPPSGTLSLICELMDLNAYELIKG